MRTFFSLRFRLFSFLLLCLILTNFPASDFKVISNHFKIRIQGNVYRAVTLECKGVRGKALLSPKGSLVCDQEVLKKALYDVGGVCKFVLEPESRGTRLDHLQDQVRYCRFFTSYTYGIIQIMEWTAFYAFDLGPRLVAEAIKTALVGGTNLPTTVVNGLKKLSAKVLIKGFEGFAKNPRPYLVQMILSMLQCSLIEISPIESEIERLKNREILDYEEIMSLESSYLLATSKAIAAINMYYVLKGTWEKKVEEAFENFAHQFIPDEFTSVRDVYKVLILAKKIPTYAKVIAMFEDWFQKEVNKIKSDKIQRTRDELDEALKICECQNNNKPQHKKENKSEDYWEKLKNIEQQYKVEPTKKERLEPQTAPPKKTSYNVSQPYPEKQKQEQMQSKIINNSTTKFETLPTNNSLDVLRSIAEISGQMQDTMRQIEKMQKQQSIVLNNQLNSSEGSLPQSVQIPEAIKLKDHWACPLDDFNHGLHPSATLCAKSGLFFKYDYTSKVATFQIEISSDKGIVRTNLPLRGTVIIYPDEIISRKYNFLDVIMTWLNEKGGKEKFVDRIFINHDC